MSQGHAASAVSARGLLLGVDATGPILALSAFSATAGLAASNGGFFASSWSWSALALLWLAIVALAVRPFERLRRAELALAAGVAALAAWTGLSALWSSDRTQTLLEGERTLVLVAAVAAVLTVAGRRPVRFLVGGVLAAIVVLSGYGLLTRLLPDRAGAYSVLAGYRLSSPVGYWNGLGIFAVMGVLLALGVAARAGGRAGRIGGALSLLVLLPALYFTFSRGAWIALGVALVALLALDPRRLRLTIAVLAYLPAPALAVFVASRSGALTHPHAALARAAHDGHRLALVLLALAAAQALIVLGLGVADARLRIPRAVRLAYAATLLALVVAGAAAVFVAYGNPATAVLHGVRSFTAPPPAIGGDLNQRLFSLSGNGRWSLWQTAWQESSAHPVLGDGAGAFGQYWLEHRRVAFDAQDAHNLYLETLAELGPIGLAFLLAFLGVPLVAAVRNRSHPLVPAAGAAFVAYLVHAAVDWDWELAGVTLAAVLAGAACVLAGRERGAPRPRAGAARRTVAGALLVGLAVVAFVGALGNAAAAKSESAVRAGDWRSAATDARKAIRWSPWSSVGWQDLAEAQLAGRRLGPARASLDRAIALDPRNWVLWFDLSAASHGRAARAALDRAQRLNPLSPDVRELRTELDAV